VASASNTGGADVPAHAIDGNTATRWSTGTPMTNGMWFEVDMTATQTFNQITMDSAGSPNDFARGYQVFVSSDGTNFGSAVATGTGAAALITVQFGVQNARYIKVIQTGTSTSWWSIAEFNVYTGGALPPPPNAPSGLTATAVSSVGINLSWTASTTTGVTYNVYRSTTQTFTPSSGNQIASGQTATTYSDTGLTPLTTYYYFVEAVNSGGNSLASNEANATTQPPPNAPSGLTATAVSSSAINLSWTASTSPNVTYSVYRSTTQTFIAAENNQIASGLTGTTYSDSGLTPATTYYYYVEAVHLGGNSAASNEANAATQAGSITQINCGGVAVSPFVADELFTNGSTINHANTIDLSGVTNPAPMAVYQSARVGTFSYTVTGFVANSSHTIRLHFAETYFTTKGSRVFNVSINGTQVLTGFDVFAAAGAQNKAVIQQFTESADGSGQYLIQFTPTVNNALISGIEIQ
jgi:hypothetical protein